MRHPLRWVAALALILLAILFLVLGNVAEAQTVELEPVAGEAQDWLAFLQQLILILVTGVLIPWVGYKLTEMKVSAKHRDQIQVTAANAAAIMLDPNLTWAEKKRAAMAYMATGARDAMDYFKSDPERVFLTVVSYYNRLVSSPELRGKTPEYVDSGEPLVPADTQLSSPGLDALRAGQS